MPLQIIQGDITKLKVDAIVNAANNQLQWGGGVCGAIFKAAASPELQIECNRIGHCDTGQAVITKGYNLKAKYIIHTVGPVWAGGHRREEALLYSAYRESLLLAADHGITSIAFPLISSGIYGYPKDQVLKVAISAIADFLKDHEMMITLVIFDRETFIIDEGLKHRVTEYTRQNYSGNEPPELSILEYRTFSRDGLHMESEYIAMESQVESYAPMEDLRDILNGKGETFTRMLLRLIDERHLTDPEVYKRANLDRKHFSKIRSNEHYKPGKNTALALAIALQLDLEETVRLLRSAGFALSPGSKADLIVEYFIKNGNYNIYEINETLFSFDENLLGG